MQVNPRYLRWMCTALVCTPLPGFAAIEVSGAPRAVTTVLQAYLEERRLDCSSQDLPARQEILATAREALDALGFFGATVSLESADTAEDCRLAVAPGRRASIAHWDLEFVNVPPQNEAAPMRGTRNLLQPQGTPFDPQAYTAIKQSLLTSLVDAGYLDAEFVASTVDVDVEHNTASVAWRVDAGPRYIVAPLLVEQPLLSNQLMLEFSALKEGDFLENAKLLKTYDNLVGSDYFAQVKVEPLLDQREDNRVPVRITATPAEKWSYLAGPGFATDSGPRFRAEAAARYLNADGHRLAFSSLLSPVAGHVKSEYRWPYGDPNHEWFSLEARYNYEDTDTAQSDIAALALRRTSRLSPRWTQTAYTEYSVEQFDVSNQDGRSQLLLFGNNFTYTSTIDASRPQFGRRVSLDVRAAADALLSDNDVVQVRLSGKQILPLIRRSRLLLRAEIGYSWQSDFEALPASLRFFAGGDKSVRGYALDTLGSLDDTGRVVGGDRLYAGSVEIDVPVRQNWSVAFFTDTGTAFFDKPNFSQSVGIGLRWYSPLGPIRADLAHPMQDSDQAVRLHISLGPDI